MRKVLWFMILFIFIAQMPGCSIWPKSGYMYEQKVLKELQKIHDEEFIVVDRGGRNERGKYKELMVAPKENPDIVFKAHRVNTYMYAGGYPLFGELIEDYLTVRRLYYMPELYEKHLGIKVESRVEIYRKGEDNFVDSRFFEETPYILAITKDNMDEMAEKIYEYCKEAKEKKAYTKMYRGMDRGYLHFIIKEFYKPEHLTDTIRLTDEDFSVEDIKQQLRDAYERAKRTVIEEHYDDYAEANGIEHRYNLRFMIDENFDTSEIKYSHSVVEDSNETFDEKEIFETFLEFKDFNNKYNLGFKAIRIIRDENDQETSYYIKNEFWDDINSPEDLIRKAVIDKPIVERTN